ncbi:cation diffusion facilitator family transporter [Campylobacter sp. PS10]|uniref:Cation diffusion facilitator family transporter n=1 Tax=Campylobacter gastrosuis TaxID=2974576 RepID=A0ABT7HR46_9BACT|nr:cation diffusion facilitator family transporter [Campylobacter gastrosuis]MDL0089381.1 cation diffusion facilitator family transporter [Campylobacter gastrosuis]
MLKISFFIIFLFMVVEVIGGFVTNSLALLSDATHMLSDALALALALLAFKIGEKNGTLRHTFGYKRVEILVAFLNSITLLAIAVWIVFEAISRFKNPPEIATFGMLAVSFVGLLVNLVVAFYMLKKADVSENVNLKGAYLHVLSDLLGSAGAVVTGLLMIFFNLFIADAIVSVLVAILVAKSGWELLKATFHILMEGSPVNVNSDEILTAILGVNGVKSIHDLHIWSISSGINALCAHVVVDSTLSIKDGQEIVKNIENALKKLNITHQTIQLETAQNDCKDELICDLKGDSNGHLGHNH